eukprot:gene6447-8000_t
MRSGQKRLNVVENVSFSIGAGETFGLVGESGCGKSITALSLIGLLNRPLAVGQGEILFKGQNLLKMNGSELRKLRGNRISMIFQEPMTALNPLATVGRQIAEMFVLHQGSTWHEAERKAIAALAQVQELCDQRGTSVLMISHDLGVIAKMCQRVGIMYAGHLVEERAVADLFRHPAHPYTHGLLASLPVLGQRKLNERKPLQEIEGIVPSIAAFPTGCRFEPRCTRASTICRDAVPGPSVLGDDSFVSVCFPVSAGLFRRSHQAVRAINNLSLSLHKNQCLSIVGESGCGKSTLALTILGLQHPTQGSISFDGKPITGADQPGRMQRARMAQMVFQDPYASLNPRQTIHAALAGPLRLHGLRNKGEAEDRIATTLKMIVEEGPWQSIFANPVHPYTRRLLAAIPDPFMIIRHEDMTRKDMQPPPLSGFSYYPEEIGTHDVYQSPPPTEFLTVGDDHKVRFIAR